MPAFRFIVMGDSRGRNFGVNEEVLRGLLQNVKSFQRQPDFILFLGDMVNRGGILKLSLLTGDE